MNFQIWIVAFCDRFLAQRTFELIVAPALADLEFEDAAGRRSRLANRAAVLRAVTGAIREDARGASAGFMKLALLSVSYFMFPVAVSGSVFKTWEGYLTAATIVFIAAMVPVLACFLPERPATRSTE
jgi:hypothetical protein